MRALAALRKRQEASVSRPDRRRVLMSSDLDQQLATTLKHHAGGDVDPTPIVAARPAARPPPPAAPPLVDHRDAQRRASSWPRRSWCCRPVGHPMAWPCRPWHSCCRTHRASLAPSHGPRSWGQIPAWCTSRPTALVSEALVRDLERRARGRERRVPGPDRAGPVRVGAQCRDAGRATADDIVGGGQPQPPADGAGVGGRPGVAWFDPSGDTKTVVRPLGTRRWALGSARHIRDRP